MATSEIQNSDPGTQTPPPELIIDRIPNLKDLLPDTLQPYWAVLEHYPLIGAMLIVMVSFMVAFLFRAILIRSLQNVYVSSPGFAEERVIRHLRKPLFTTILFFGFTLAAQIANLEVVTNILVNLSVSVIVASGMRAAFHLSTTILESLSSSHNRIPVIEPQTIPILNLSVRLIVILVGSYCLLIIWGINPLGWLASAGIVGIAVGFAAKDTLANLFSGFFILVDAPYKVGDYVNLDSGERGRVTHIGLRSTRLMSRDDIEITLPNAVIANAKIVNESGGINSNIRIAIAVSVAYGSDVDQVCEILQTIGNRYEEFCELPEPRVRMRAFGASGLDFELLGWIHNPEDRGRIRHEMLMEIYKQFAAAGIEIPYHKTDVYVKEFPKG
ncbi:mechanosensitive ion channel family protein [Amphritea pacifica]|uniref:mechanosensitive ion channel family protein n=1 Tax=Amphritea pacifica TaxID=2811233 RepID=UPI00196453A6|nr:mechanosensitive ion channel family protein [Amphritea pacifica]MBN1005669.1 mechanosensitive ion channel family protein [Amphritea pacifica]